ncbi:phage terminase large subunit family protein [Pseudoroseomonas cervicalis]|uniref:phage terminase large subunit family protein n=1 Tax=Teichococcus cervicalis TaxID=204525 RepID=UPI002782E86A|nr:terminase gpA endonuclease subunit [Pseudoroseomonas cervicalis]MDQ1079703.1 phage terminase large subunit GpA-like protein [Pseudoroseomonas cervicalis]
MSAALDLPASRPVVFGAAARGLMPDPVRTCWEWAEEHRIVPPESGSPVPGPYRTDLVPYLREPMEVMSLSHPAERVTFKKSAQVGATDAELNLLGQIMAETPAPVLVVTPSIQMASDYNKLKLDPMIRSSAILRQRVDEVVSRDGDGSTATFKRFSGGFLQVVGANASKALQMRSARVVIFEELSEFPDDSDGRGAPEDQALERTQAWSERGIKVVDCSTPGEGGRTHDGKLRCRVTALYEQSSKGRYVVPCPHCRYEQDLKFEQLHYTEEAPELAHYVCEACGEAIEHRHKRDIVARGSWVHEFPERLLKHAGYAINALYSPFISWARIALRLLAAKGDPRKEKVVAQQIKGEAYEARHDMPSEAVLYTRREIWRAPVPAEVLFLVGATDCQGDRLVSSVWGFDRDLSPYKIHVEILPGKPTEAATWKAHDELMARSWRSAWGHEMRPVSWGIDTGYATHHVYRYCRRHAARSEPKIYALDGQGDPRLPPLSAPSKRDVTIDGEKIGVVLLWPVGTYNLKIDIADALRKTEQGPDTDGVWPVGAMRFSEATTLEHLSELTAETLEDVLDRNKQVTGRRWIKRRTNDLLDTAVYARALAMHGTAGMTEARWAALEAEIRRPVDAQQDLQELWTPTLAARTAPAEERAAEDTGTAAAAGNAAEAAPAAPAAKPEAEPEEEERPTRRRMGFGRQGWFGRSGREEHAW